MTCIMSDPSVGHAVAHVIFERDVPLVRAAPDLFAALEALEPYLDRLVCYASGTEFEPNAAVKKAGQALALVRRGE